MSLSQFLCCKTKDVLVGFGRIKSHQNCQELCSLGVIEPLRNKGVGKALVKKLIENTTQQLYLVCIIANYFEKLEFKQTTVFPPEIQDKLNYCTNTLIVEEVYVAMTID